MTMQLFKAPIKLIANADGPDKPLGYPYLDLLGINDNVFFALAGGMLVSIHPDDIIDSEEYVIDSEEAEAEK